MYADVLPCMVTGSWDGHPAKQSYYWFPFSSGVAVRINVRGDDCIMSYSGNTWEYLLISKLSWLMPGVRCWSHRSVSVRSSVCSWAMVVPSRAPIGAGYGVAIHSAEALMSWACPPTGKPSIAILPLFRISQGPRGATITEMRRGLWAPSIT